MRELRLFAALFVLTSAAFFPILFVDNAYATCTTTQQTVAAASTAAVVLNTEVPVSGSETATATPVLVQDTCGGDDVSYQVALPTSVSFGGVNYTAVYATTNSVIAFGRQDNTYCCWPNTPSISVNAYDWVVLSTANTPGYPGGWQSTDEHLILTSSQAGFQVDLAVRPYGSNVAGTPLSTIIVTASINPDHTLTITYLSNVQTGINTRTGVVMPDGTHLTLAEAGMTQVYVAPVVTAEVIVEPTPTPSPTESPTPTPSPTPSETATPQPSPTPTLTPTPEPSSSPTPLPQPSPEPVPEPYVPDVVPPPAIEPPPALEPEPAPEEIPTPEPDPSDIVLVVDPEPIPIEIPPVEEPPPTEPTPETELPTDTPPDQETDTPPDVAPVPDTISEDTPPLPSEPPVVEEVAPEPPVVVDENTTAETWAPEVAPEEYLAPDEISAYKEIGLVPNSVDQLPTDVPKEAPAEVLVPHVQIDVPGVENGGIQFFGTKSQPQVVQEDGTLTPPAPPPGSGDPIPPDAITIEDTFIGQVGGTTFNAPDVAVPVVLVPLTGAIASVPGAEAVNKAFNAMQNIGNDMSPITRKKAKKILVITAVLGQIAQLRRRF